MKRNRHTQGEDSHVKTEVEIGVFLPEAKECLRPPEPGRGKEGVFTILQRTGPCQHLHFRHIDSKTVRE